MDNHEQTVIEDIINAFLREPTEENMDVLIQRARKDDLSDNNVLTLAKGLARSGEYLELQHRPSLPLLDIPSTGGPSSLSTLLCPLFLVHFNNAIVKLGVAGRPAGGIDVLYQIKNYNINPSKVQIEEWLQSCQYVHFIANEKYTPLDAKLFAHRKVKNSIDVPSLVIASLLAKKIAVGLNAVGLDIRVSKFGNFGKTWGESKTLGTRFNKIAALAGIKSKCFLTNGDRPQQNYIGRGEALLALAKIFNNSADPILNKHYLQCLSMASSIGNSTSIESPSLDDTKKIFFSNVTAQQGVVDSFFEIASRIEKEHLHEVIAERTGFLDIDIYSVRDAIVEINRPAQENPFPDYCGIILKQNMNDYVNKGDIICTYRCSESSARVFRERITRAISIRPTLHDTNDFEEVL